MNDRDPASAADAAAKAGHFDNLALAGQPLQLGKPGDPDWWIKGFVERENIDTELLAPPTVRLRRQSRQFADNVETFRTEADLVEAAESLNRQILEDRLRPATTSTPIVAQLVDVEAMVELWRSHRRRRTAAPEPATPPETASAKKSWWRWW